MPLPAPLRTATIRADAGQIWWGVGSALFAVATALWEGHGVAVTFLIALAAFPLAFMTAMLVPHRLAIASKLSAFLAVSGDVSDRSKAEIASSHKAENQLILRDLLLFFHGPFKRVNVQLEEITHDMLKITDKKGNADAERLSSFILDQLCRNEDRMDEARDKIKLANGPTSLDETINAISSALEVQIDDLRIVREAQKALEPESAFSDKLAKLASCVQSSQERLEEIAGQPALEKLRTKARSLGFYGTRTGITGRWDQW